MRFLAALFSVLIIASCSSGPPKVSEPSYRKPSSGAKRIYLSNNTNLNSTNDLKSLSAKISGSKVYYSSNYKVDILDLGGAILDGSKQKGDGSQNENQEPLFRATHSFILQNGFVQNNKNAAYFYAPNSGVINMTFTKFGEDAVACGKNGTNFLVQNSQFINKRSGDKSIQLNQPKGAKINNNLIFSGITGVRLSFVSSSDSASSSNNKFIGCDTAFNLSKGTLTSKGDSFEKVRLKYKTDNGASVK
jgi:hypothetical protein